jgi:opacity protein-like surface antigen
MKKTGLLTFVIFTITFNAWSQRFEGGILGGFNGSQVDGDTYKGYNKPGILAGTWVQTDFAPAVFAGMELKFSQKGARNRINPKDPKKYIMRLNYVDLPVFIGFRTNDLISVIGGISTGYLISSAEYNEDGKFPPEDQKPFNNFDLQPFVGFQFNFLEKITLDLRLAYSVLPVRGKPENDLWYWRQNQFNNVISTALYYRIGR